MTCVQIFSHALEINAIDNITGKAITVLCLKEDLYQKYFIVIISYSQSLFWHTLK